MKQQLTNKHFHILGVTKYSTVVEIKKAYRDLIKRWHPDKFPDNSIKQSQAQEKCKIIIDAFERFKDFVPEIRKESAPKIPSSNNIGRNIKLTNVVMIRVNSKTVSSVGYEPKEMILQVELKNGTIYLYYKITQEIYSLLMMVGFNESYFKKSIASRFRRLLVK